MWNPELPQSITHESNLSTCQILQETPYIELQQKWVFSLIFLYFSFFVAAFSPCLADWSYQNASRHIPKILCHLRDYTEMYIDG